MSRDKVSTEALLILKSLRENARVGRSNKLAESATELYLCTDPKKAEKLWATVAKALDKTAASDKLVKRILDTKDIKGLAEVVSKLSK